MTLAPPSCVSSTDNTYQKAGAFVDPLDPPDVNQSPELVTGSRLVGEFQNLRGEEALLPLLNRYATSSPRSCVSAPL